MFLKVVILFTFFSYTCKSSVYKRTLISARDQSLASPWIPETEDKRERYVKYRIPPANPLPSFALVFTGCSMEM